MDYSPDPLISPSKAAQAASLSRAWSEVNSFLAPLFHPNPIPPFEKNDATLSALLTLASHSTSQTDQNALLASTQAQALRELREAQQQDDPAALILSSIEDSLTPSGRQALNTLASLSVALGSVSTNPTTMASQLANLTRSECEVEQQIQRVESLHQQLKSEHALAIELLAKLRSNTNNTTASSTSASEDFHQPHQRNSNNATNATLAQKTSDWNRGTKQIGLKMNDYKSRAKTLDQSQPPNAGKKPDFGLPEIKTEERELRDLEKRVRGLEGRVRGFDGLPPDRDMALMEVERMRRELEGLVRKRDGLFEGLVEGCRVEGGK